MDYGYWDLNSKTIPPLLCRQEGDNFTEEEVLLLIEALYSKFKIIAKSNKRKRETGVSCWRIRFSTKNDNLDLLRYIIKHYF